MKKFIIIIISFCVCNLTIAAVPDISSISDAQKRAFLNSMSASEKQKLLDELQDNLNTSDTPLEEVSVVDPKPLPEESMSEEQPQKFSKEIDYLESCEREYSMLALHKQKKIAQIDVPKLKRDLSVTDVKSLQDSENLNNAIERNEFIEACIVELKESAAIDDLKPFGYDLFSGTPTTFAPVTEIPVPQNYILGPGDTLEIFKYGNENGNSTHVVDRSGVINIDGIGPLVVSGLSFNEVKEAISDRFSTQMIGVKTSVTLGELRSIRVFILGEANRSGSYTVSSLSTITNALFVSGGVSEIGSLRNIQLKRNGKLISSLDLYDLLLRGDTRNDVKLQPGDVIFIPTVGDQVTVSGSVKRPAIYETKREHHLEDFIKLAGGMLPDAHLQDINITRFEANQSRQILNANYFLESGRQLKINSGDVISVNQVLNKIENSVTLSGHVKREVKLGYYKGIRVSDLVMGIDNLKDKVDLEYALIRRLVPPTNQISVKSFNLRQALLNPSSNDNLTLEPRDTVYVFEIGAERQTVILPLMDELEQQSGNGVLLKQVSVGGRIKIPGIYPLEESMSVSDLIRAGGGLANAAYRLEAEITRDELSINSEMQKRHIPVDLERVLSGSEAEDIKLESRDSLFIKEVPNWREDHVIEVLGEVNFPGRYPIKPGETLGEVMLRAGGLNQNAFSKGTLFIRESLKEKERRYLLSLADKLEKDITFLSIQRDSGAVELGGKLLEQLRQTDAVGRLVIDIDSVIANVGDDLKDVILQNGDKIFIPQKTQEVTVIGEVQFPTSHLHNGRTSRNVYIEQSGGYTSKADTKRVYVVRADGSVINREYSSWFSQGDFAHIQPGDTIVVPLNADKVRALTLWTSVAQILSQIGIFAASARTVGLL